MRIHLYMTVALEKAELEALPYYEKIDITAVNAALDKLRFGGLTAALSSSVIIRRLGLHRWLRELSKITETPVKLRTTDEQITPHMQESGVICFCEKDIYRPQKLFMILAHEAAHFILMRDSNYGLIKKLDGEYRPTSVEDQKMRSPVELCANIITLLILNRSRESEKRQNKQRKIEDCIKTLKKQLTNC